ncbi:MAG: MBOAT family protein [Spirochaetota bacterium]|nr:MBOAT family protein [Spirochaetota bacterium]
MVFSSQEFIFLFLPLTILTYLTLSYLKKIWIINLVLLIWSLLFYFWGSNKYIILIVSVVIVNYIFGLLIEKYKNENITKKLLLFIGISIHLLILFYFKYFNFFMDQVNTTLAFFSIESYHLEKIILPIGISFYIFQSITYLVDLYRGDVGCVKNPLKISLYVSLFPQLIAGPIVRYKSIAQELSNRNHDLNKVSAGITRFIHGLAKKVIIADTMAIIADSVFSSTQTLTAADAWIGVIAYTIQIYFDFSGYSDMAIGLGLMFGFHFPENFNRPYSSLSITDFWRRWHITLSQFFRDYVYIPLGGSKNGIKKTYINLIVIFFLTGFWHGANWTFVIWGAYHGVLLIIERILNLRNIESSRYPILRRFVTLLLIMVGWVLFRSDNMTHAISILTSMFSFNNIELSLLIEQKIDSRVLICLLLGLLTFIMPRDLVIGKLMGDHFTLNELNSKQLKYKIIMTFYLIMVFSITVITLSNQTYSPFLYFQF